VATPLRVLIVEDNPADAELLVHELGRAGFAPDWDRVQTEAGYLAHLNPGLDVILADYTLPGFDAMLALRLLQDRRLDIPFIIVSGGIGEDTAVAAMKLGATDYLLKDRLGRLGLAVGQALEQRRAAREAVRQREALRTSETRYQNLFEGVPVGLFRSTPTGQILDGNRALVQMLGYPDRGALVALEAIDLYSDPVERERFQALLEQRDVVRDFDARARRLDGSSIWVRVNARAVRDAAGRAMYYEGSVEDITARKEAEEALRDSETRYRTLFEESRDAIYIVTRAGEFIDFNHAALELLGYTREEMARLNADDLYARPEEGATFQREIEERGFVRDYEVRVRKKDRTEMDCILTATVRRASDGSLRGYQGSIRDITERTRLEEQIRQLQKMEAVGRLAGGIAHDFNNLLTVIIGRTQLLPAHLKSEDLARKDVALIEKTAERAAALTRQLLAFSRRQVLQPRVLDLNAVVGGMGMLVQRLIGEDIELISTARAGLGTVRVDPGQIEQVIMNLAVNARDAMPGGGRLTIETANADLDENYARSHVGVTPGPYVMLAVSDTGCGMDAETQAHLFEPFFTTKEEGKGTGLGLSTVYGIVKQSGGNIWVYSEPGRGTSVKIYLPRVEEPVDSPAAAQPTVPIRGSETILLVEDDEGVRSLARDILQAYGYSVLEAPDGNEAMLFAERHPGPIHLLVTDVVLPQMNGRELAERLARERPEMRVLYLSGYTDEAIIHHGVLDQGTPFLQKPYTPGTLAQKVRGVLDSSSTASPQPSAG
jgi:PAS domain S-box-containing protein